MAYYYYHYYYYYYYRVAQKTRGAVRMPNHNMKIMILRRARAEGLSASGPCPEGDDARQPPQVSSTYSIKTKKGGGRCYILNHIKIIIIRMVAKWWQTCSLSACLFCRSPSTMASTAPYDTIVFNTPGPPCCTSAHIAIVLPHYKDRSIDVYSSNSKSGI